MPDYERRGGRQSEAEGPATRSGPRQTPSTDSDSATSAVRGGATRRRPPSQLFATTTTTSLIIQGQSP